jgi:hypothetical protein
MSRYKYVHTSASRIERIMMAATAFSICFVQCAEKY